MIPLTTVSSGALALVSNNNNQPATRNVRTLPDLVAQFEEEEALHNDDVVLPLSKLQATPDGTIEVPNLGAFALNDWSRQQMSSLLGMRWDRWFENASPAERAEELNRRLARTTDEVRVRTGRDVEAGVQAEGTLRALVSVGYSPVEDSQVAKLVITAMKHVDGDMRIIRANVTNQSTSFVVAIGRPYKVGGDGQVGDVWGGLLIRNSGVGFASLMMVAHLVRLACRNGMVCPMPDAVLLRRRHRGLDDKKLRWELAERIEQLPAQLRSGGEVLRLAEGRPVQDIEGEIRKVLRQANLPQRFVQPVVEAYGREPISNAFGISQAITLAAQRFSPEDRLTLERAAGEYLMA